MINKYTNKQRGLLAVIMAMVMVFAGAAFVAAEVDAEVDADDVLKAVANGFTVEYEDTLKTTISGETISFEGYVVMESDPEYSTVFNNIDDYWGTVRITDLKGDINIKQTNTAFEIAYPGLHDNNVKQQDYQLGEEGDDLIVLVPKDGSTVQLEFTTGTGESAVTKKLNLDFSKVSTMIVLDGDLSGTGWEYTSQELSFTNYNGREVFTVNDSFDGKLTINFSGENTISAYAYTYAVGNEIHGSSVINVYTNVQKALDVSFAEGSSANITMNTPHGMGIVAGTTTIAGESGETLTINGANRGLYSVGDLTVTNMTIISTASEYAVRVYDGCTFSVVNSEVTSIISDPKGNGQGYDNINGIKTGAITIDDNSEVSTYGLYVTGDDGVGVDAIGDLIFVKGYRAYVAKGVTINGSIWSDDNVSSITFSDCTATEAFEITAGSIILEDGTEISSGDVTITGNAIVKGEVTVGNIVLASGATLTIEEGATLGATSITPASTPAEVPKVIVKGTLDATVNANDDLKVEVQPGATTDGVTGNIDYKDSFGMSQDLESDYTVKTNAFLEKDLTIPKDVTLTVEGTLDLNGNKLTVIGNLVVSKKGVIESNYKAGGSILLSKTGVISNIGMIGNTTQVVIGNADGTETVTMKGVSGIEFSLTKVNAAYKLTVSGEVAIKVKESNLLTITGAYLANGFTVKDVGTDDEPCNIDGIILKDATVTIGSKTVVDAEIEMQNGSTLIVNGVIDGTVNMVNGAEVIINGESDATYTAKTGDFTTYNTTTNKKQTAEDAYADNVETVVESSVETDGLKGIIITVTTKSYTADDEVKTPMTEQKLLVSGIAAVADDKDKNAKATLEVIGKAYIAEGSELVIPDEVIIVANKIITEGLLKVINPTDGSVNSDDDVVFVGTKYTITVTDETTYDETVTDYYTTFDAAYAAIADADKMTITISGGYEFAKDYIIAAGQTVEAAAGEFTITKDGTITIQDEGVLDLPKLVVKGLLTVIYGADCDVTDLTYEVMSKNTETGDITYSGAELAIENAVAGDVIDIVDDVVFEDPVTIAEGVTVNVENEASITAEKGLTVAGKLVNEGTVEIADEYDLIVTGEIENEVTITLGIESVMTVTGTVVSDDAISGTINAASYTDEDNNVVYTTVASAVASGEDVAVSGKFTENADVVLAEEQTLTINGEVVLKSIRLVAGSTLTVGTDGILTADVIAAVGTEETTGALSDAVVDVTKINNISGWTVNYNEAKATYTMVMPAYTSGDVVIEAGSVNYNDANASFGAVTGSTPVVYKTMKVASGATLVVTGNVTDDASKKYFVNEGTIVVSDSKNFTNVLLGGTVNVDLGKTLTLTASQIVGEVVLATEEGKTPASVAISGQVLIGSTPKTLGAAGSIVGKVTFATANDYVVVFEGSTFNNTDDSVKTLSTAYTINDIAFATVYTTVQNVDVNNINKIVAGLKDLDVVDVMNDTEKAAYEADPSTYTRNYANDITWYSGSLKATAVGQYDAVNAKIGYKSVSFIVAVGPGLQVYIDDVEYSTMIKDGKVTETIGTHTVTVYLQKGYEGTPAITFNGQTITDGKLVLTSDMLGKENKLVVTGATVMQDQPVVIQPSDSEKDGMELTDILLIVLVVLIVIMAIIVALRMMRS